MTWPCDGALDWQSQPGALVRVNITDGLEGHSPDFFKLPPLVLPFHKCLVNAVDYVDLATGPIAVSRKTERPRLCQLCAVSAREELFGPRKRQVTLGPLSHPCCGSHSCNFSPGSANSCYRQGKDISVSVQAPMRALKSLLSL